MTAYNLNQLVNVEVLQEIQERFAVASGLGVIIADEHGQPITNPSNFTNFCSKMRSTEEGGECCALSDQSLGRQAVLQEKPTVHYCHAGLIDLAAPIVLNGHHLGSVLCGQVLMEPQDKKQIQFMREQFKHFSIEKELLEQYVQEIEFSSQRRIDSTLQMLQLVADYIVKIGSTHMVEEELNNKLMKELEVHIQLESLLQETELKVLQTQVNPHFLFNTLNTISRIAYLENAEQTQNVTYSLAKIMRYSLRSSTEPVTLKEELDYIQSYLTIQQSRFRNQIQYEQLLEIDAEAIKVPIFSIQPLIENAIIHGLEPQSGDLKIKFHGYLKEGNVILEISDTGVGVSEDRIATIFSAARKKSNSHTTGIGMNNVQQRIKHYFGKEYGISDIKSEIGRGTTVQITLPAVVEVDALESHDSRR
ncbi:sensor histidine kinase [Planococcus wigleyi]|uniref:histidine kinase n=1 Tax=Planococcus wigleyi TaxID=2762216 RepID=A0ABR8W8R4_9BACL|nr:PocR ligand-binding domain-containing protein [Planococcus wigleyi]MBD8013412.1 PocR ligand-binding domain-containing protein [Planococcus wigleyi]